MASANVALQTLRLNGYEAETLVSLLDHDVVTRKAQLALREHHMRPNAVERERRLIREDEALLTQLESIRDHAWGRTPGEEFS